MIVPAAIADGASARPASMLAVAQTIADHWHAPCRLVVSHSSVFLSCLYILSVDRMSHGCPQLLEEE